MVDNFAGTFAPLWGAEVHFHWGVAYFELVSRSEGGPGQQAQWKEERRRRKEGAQNFGGEVGYHQWGA